MGTYRITLSEQDATATPDAEGMALLSVCLEDPEHALTYRVGFRGPANLLEDPGTAEQQRRVCAWISEGVLAADSSSPATQERPAGVWLPTAPDHRTILNGARTSLSSMIFATRFGFAHAKVTVQTKGHSFNAFDWSVAPSAEALAEMARAERRQTSLEGALTPPPSFSSRPRI